MAENSGEVTQEEIGKNDDGKVEKVEPPPDTSWVKNIEIKRILVDDRVRDDG